MIARISVQAVVILVVLVQAMVRVGLNVYAFNHLHNREIVLLILSVCSLSVRFECL